MKLPPLDESLFIEAWLVAPIASLVPLVFLILPMFIVLQALEAVLLVLYVGVIIFGIPTSLLYAGRGKCHKFGFVMLGGIFGLITPLISIPINTALGFDILKEEIEMIAGFAVIFGPFHGALCANIYHKIVYKNC